MKIESINFSQAFKDEVILIADGLSCDSPTTSCPPPFNDLEISITENKDASPVFLVENATNEQYPVVYIYRKPL